MYLLGFISIFAILLFEASFLIYLSDKIVHSFLGHVLTYIFQRSIFEISLDDPHDWEHFLSIL